MSTIITERYMGKENAERCGKRNAVTGELLIRVKPTKIVAQKDLLLNEDSKAIDYGLSFTDIFRGKSGLEIVLFYVVGNKKKAALSILHELVNFLPLCKYTLFL